MSFIVKIKLQLIVNWYKTEIIGWRKPSGESGTILTLINGIYLSKEYPKLLMID